MHDIYSLTAGDLMTANVDTVSEGDSVRNAIEKMVGLEISALPVVAAGGRCVGVITKTDIIKFLGGGDEMLGWASSSQGQTASDPGNTAVSDLMTRHVLVASPRDLVPEVAEKMLLHEIHHVPVCDETNEVLGVISAMDLVKAIQVTARQAAACQAVPRHGTGATRMAVEGGSRRG